jgi:5'-nucleotidase
MKFLLTNDDGYFAPGLQALAAAARNFGEVFIVAPEKCYSGCGHQTTTEHPLQVTQRESNVYSVNGTPADCVRVGLLHLGNQFDWVLSGVNHGGNLGVDIYMSGTVAAVREAMLLQCRGIALSQYRKRRESANWEKTQAMTEHILSHLLHEELPPREFWNVNFPDTDTQTLPDFQECPVELEPLPFSLELQNTGYQYKSNYHARPQTPGHDVAVCFSGQIAVSRVGHSFR